MMMMAITASVIQCAGLLLPYLELAKRNGRVVGISEFCLDSYSPTMTAYSCRLHVPYH